MTAAKETYLAKVREAQRVGAEFVTACGGSVSLRAFRIYMETRERSDSVISRAICAPDSPLKIVHSPVDGERTIQLEGSAKLSPPANEPQDTALRRKIRAIANSIERQTDAAAITYQDATEREQVTRPFRNTVRMLREALDETS